LDKIAFYLQYEKGISISKYLEKRLGKSPIEHSWIVEEEGNLLGISWLHYHGIDGNVQYAFDWAAQNCHLEVVQLLHENRSEGCTVNAMDWAAKNAHLEVVQWLHQNRKEGCTADAMDSAARYGHLKLWNGFVKQCEYDPGDFFEAGNGYLEVFQWRNLNRNEGCTEEAMDLAAENGELERYYYKICKYFHSI
jgi:hypothetical protein